MKWRRQAQAVMAAVDRQLEMFFAEALQLEPRIIQHEHGLDASAGG